MRAPALRISNIVHGRQNQDGRVRYLVDPSGDGDERAIPEDIVLKRWRRRRHEDYRFGGDRLGPNLWRGVALALGRDPLELASMPEEVIATTVEDSRAILRTASYTLPSARSLRFLLFGLGESRIERLLDRHLSADRRDRYGTPDLLLWALGAGDGALAHLRLVEVKRPGERVSRDQVEEIAFLRSLGVAARVFRLIERTR